MRLRFGGDFSWGLCIALAAVTLVFVSPLGGAGAHASSSAKAKSCPAAKMRVAFVRNKLLFPVPSPLPKKAKVSCEPVPSPAPSDTHQLATMLDRGMSPKLLSREAERILRDLTSKRLRKYSAQMQDLLLDRAGSAPARARPTSTSTDIDSLGPGAKLEVKTTKTEADPGEIGSFNEIEMTLEFEKGRDHGRLSKRVGLGKPFVRQCPDASGIVTGDWRMLIGDTVTGSVGGEFGSVAFDHRADAKITARVGDDARLKTYDYVGDLEVQVRPKDEDGREYPSTFRVHFSQQEIDPRAGLGETPQDILKAFSSTQIAVRGPQGETQQAFDGTLGLLLMSLMMLRTDVNAALIEAEKGWYEQEKCVRIDAGATPAEVDPGGAVLVDVAARSTVDGSAITPATIVAGHSPCGYIEEGAFSPTTTTSPGQVTVTDTGTWERGSDYGLCFSVTSKRGRGTGGAGWHVKGAWNWPDSFTGIASGQYTNSDGLLTTWTAEFSAEQYYEDADGAGYGGSPEDTTGTLNWEIGGSRPDGCEVSGSGTAQAGYTGTMSRFDMRYGGTISARQSNGGGTIDCPDQPPNDFSGYYGWIAWWVCRPEGSFTQGATTLTAGGPFVDDHQGFEGTCGWQLTASSPIGE